MSKYGAIGTLLRERLDQLLRRVGKIERDLRSTPDRDSEERASEVENDEVLEGLDEMSRAEVGQIREALRRIERTLRHLLHLWSAHQREAPGSGSPAIGLGGPPRLTRSPLGGV